MDILDVIIVLACIYGLYKLTILFIIPYSPIFFICLWTVSAVIGFCIALANYIVSVVENISVRR